MTYFLAALENTKARLCAKTAQTTDKATAEMIAAAWREAGYIVNEWHEA